MLGISLFVAAHDYKIVPFLVWYHRFGPLAGLQPVPKVAELYWAPWATASGVLLVVGTTALAAGVGTGVAGMARGGAALLAIGSAILAAQMVALARRRPDPTVTAAPAVAPLPESDPPLSHGVRIP